ncbi:Arc family DNA-binding protein [Proteus mirabilis]|uniref:Arc family DNA-binding protein n=1 Tax=Proteus mirabilis TaxID=584 RepID=UPI0010726938|nr:Arc family DNA-binding protein [Proteus mirabilis]MBG5978067.1 Arc family DNA-binding protein [Proteus mirabilis]MCD4631655.1 Arc family DNA-binding protein [Proteus mirabilis]QFV06369.1 Arc family DNA-binding protein [Proteus mirabilis]TFT77717.1 Arc family DNA-binding protein [Proteus mirabilis]HCD1115782.1 Arc family DNA-binding protein [Proteus mirabilis]
MSKYPSQTQDKFTVRFPDGMRDEIAKRAEANGRSMNSEIVQILQDALNSDDISNIEDCDNTTSNDFKKAARRMLIAIEEFEEMKRKLYDVTEENGGISLLSISPKD